MDKTRRSAHCQQMYKLIEEWEQSGVSQKQFCQQQGISLSSFLYWRRRFIKTSRDFIPLDFSASIAGHTGDRIEITYPNGIRLQLPPSSNINHLLRLVKMD